MAGMGQGRDQARLPVLLPWPRASLDKKQGWKASVLFVAQIHYKPHFLLFFLDPASAGSNLLVQGFKLILNRLLLGVPSNLTLPSWVS